MNTFYIAIDAIDLGFKATPSDFIIDNLISIPKCSLLFICYLICLSAQEGRLQDLDYKHKALRVFGRRGPAFDNLFIRLLISLHYIQ